MKVNREQFEQNHEKILASAAKLLREHGFESVTLSAVMKDAGLTHGGFYGHFQSKDDLVSQACAHSAKTLKADTMNEYCASYLSEAHRDNPGKGCILAALGAEAARQGPAVRHELTNNMLQIIEQLATTMPKGSAKSRRSKAIAAYSSMLGGLILSRLVDDPQLSKELLTINSNAVRASLVQKSD